MTYGGYDLLTANNVSFSESPSAHAITPDKTDIESPAAITVQPAAANAASWPQTRNIVMKVRGGDTLATVIGRTGIDTDTTFQIVAALKGKFSPKSLQTGQEIKFQLERSNAAQKKPVLTQMSIDQDIDSRLMVSLNDDGAYNAEIQAVPVTHESIHTGGVISGSLFLSAQRQGIPANVVTQLIGMFSYDVDFQREIKEGDRFELYFDRSVSADGKKTREGDILYAKLILSDKPIELYRYVAVGESAPEYFHADGTSVKKALMRTPIDGARLASGFGLRRHPVLGYTKMHKGVDFAASRGTPIMAAGNGVVVKASPYGSYGNYIQIRHNSTYSTAYAHMNAYAKGMRVGARVKQGQIIGYVGTTGRSTGPHLHYEVLMAGRQTNPLGLKIPTGTKLTARALVAFQNYTRGMDREVAALPMTVMVARN